LLSEGNCTLHVKELLRMTQRQKEEGLLPRTFERRKVTGLQAIKSKRESLLVLCIGARRLPVKGSGELIQDNNER